MMPIIIPSVKYLLLWLLLLSMSVLWGRYCEEGKGREEGREGVIVHILSISYLYCIVMTVWLCSRNCCMLFLFMVVWYVWVQYIYLSIRSSWVCMSWCMSWQGCCTVFHRLCIRDNYQLILLYLQMRSASWTQLFSELDYPN